MTSLQDEELYGLKLAFCCMCRIRGDKNTLNFNYMIIQFDTLHTGQGHYSLLHQLCQTIQVYLSRLLELT